MITEYCILRCLKRYNKTITLLPEQDVLQEIRIALFLSKNDKEVFRAASSAVYRLASEYGYSRKKGKDKFEPFYENVEFSEKEKDAISDIEIMYLDEGNTARYVAEKYGIEYTNKLQKILCACFPKHRKTKNRKNI